MSLITDVLKSGASSIAGTVSDKLGIDPATAQGFIDQAMPGEQAASEEVAPEAQEAEELATTDQAEAAPDAEQGMLGKVTDMLGGTQSITDKAKAMLDQDGDGNPLNDVVGMVGKFFGKS